MVRSWSLLWSVTIFYYVAVDVWKISVQNKCIYDILTYSQEQYYFVSSHYLCSKSLYFFPPRMIEAAAEITERGMLH